MNNYNKAYEVEYRNNNLAIIIIFELVFLIDLIL